VQSRPLQRAARLRFARHYLEMVGAMVAGMVLLAPLESLVASVLGHPHVLDAAMVTALLMAANMTVATAGWMWLRRHRPRLIAEMAAGMNVPFLVLVLVAPLQGHASGEHGHGMISGTVLTIMGMSAAMLARRQEYASGAPRSPMRTGGT
jgi:hypothetical protein